MTNSRNSTIHSTNAREQFKQLGPKREWVCEIPLPLGLGFRAIFQHKDNVIAGLEVVGENLGAARCAEGCRGPSNKKPTIPSASTLETSERINET